jgi:hypothetical protein
LHSSCNFSPQVKEPAAYPNTDTAENLAIQIVEQLLDINRVKADIRRRDKVPNSDGYLELVDSEGRPIGKLELQVRKMKDDSTSATCGADLIAYSQRITSPFIYVGVDVNNKRAYWRHISSPMVELKEGNQSCTLRFDPDFDSIGSGFPFFERWLLLVRDTTLNVSGGAPTEIYFVSVENGSPSYTGDICLQAASGVSQLVRANISFPASGCQVVNVYDTTPSGVLLYWFSGDGSAFSYFIEATHTSNNWQLLNVCYIPAPNTSIRIC